MIESSAFELFEEKGRVEGMIQDRHRVLLQLGRKTLGPPDAATEAAVRAIRDFDRLERLTDAVLTTSSWQEFLATP